MWKRGSFWRRPKIAILAFTASRVGLGSQDTDHCSVAPGRQESWGLFNTNHPATCGLSHLLWSRGITWAQHYIRVPGELRVGSMDSVDSVEHLENKQVLFLMKYLKVVNPPYSFI